MLGWFNVQFLPGGFSFIINAEHLFTQKTFSESLYLEEINFYFVYFVFTLVSFLFLQRKKAYQGMRCKRTGGVFLKLSLLMISGGKKKHFKQTLLDYRVFVFLFSLLAIMVVCHVAIKQNQIIGDLNEEPLHELMNFSFGCSFPYNNDVTISTVLLFTLV